MREFYNKEIEALHNAAEPMLTGHSGGFLFDIREVFSRRKIRFGWVRISTSGNLGLCDYGCGLHDVSVYASGEGYRDKDGKIQVRYNVRFRVGTGDDGSWGAWGPSFDTLDECLTHVEKVAPILDDLVSLPTEDELNKMLQPFGMFGEFEP